MITLAVVNITIKERIASAPASIELICNNPTDTIKFIFDNEWNEHTARIARFEWHGNYIDVPFTGDSVKVPEITNTLYVFVGVYADGIASTPVKLMCKRSILCHGDAEYVPPKHTYWDEFKETLDALNEAAEEMNLAAERAENAATSAVTATSKADAAATSANNAANEAKTAVAAIDEVRLNEYYSLDVVQNAYKDNVVCTIPDLVAEYTGGTWRNIIGDPIHLEKGDYQLVVPNAVIADNSGNFTLEYVGGFSDPTLRLVAGEQVGVYRFTVSRDDLDIELRVLLAGSVEAEIGAVYGVRGAQIVTGEAAIPRSVPEIEALVNRKLDAIPTKNLFDKNASDVLVGYRISTTGDITTDASVHFASGMIAVDGNAQYVLRPAIRNGASYACYDRNGEYIDVGGYPTMIDIADSGGVITTPAGARYLRFSGKIELMDSTQLEVGTSATEYEPYGQYKPMVDMETRIRTLENADVLNGVLTYTNDLNPEETTDGYYINEYGLAYESANYCYTDYISIGEGVYAFYRDLATADIRFASYYDRNNVFLQTVSYPDSVGGVDGACYVRLTLKLTEKSDIMVTRNPNPHEWLAHGEVRTLEKFLDTGADFKTGVLQVETATLASGGILTLIKNLDVKKNKTLVFSAQITAFDTLYVGHGESSYGGTYLKIDGSAVTVYEYLTSATKLKTAAHGLNFSSFVSVIVDVAVSAKITIVTASGSFTMEGVPWGGCNGAIYAKSTGSTLTDCTLKWTSADLFSNVWVFGDSYLGLTNPARFPYHLLDMGFDNWLACGYPGAGAASQVTCFKNLLAMRKPKMAIWCMGMNNPDSGAVSSGWLTATQTFISLCESNNITPVLATIPSAWGSTADDSDITVTRDNSYKNAWVRASGYRFVDFEKAVGADGGSEWYDGMLSSDGVHPTELGAKALAARLVVDVPEITF